MWTPWIPSPAHPAPWAPPARGPRRALIGLLLRASALLVRTAVRVQRAPLIAAVPEAAAFGALPKVQALAGVPKLPAAVVPKAPSVATVASLALPAADEPSWVSAREFHAVHADAGAPEGALYVDGRLIGWLSGVARL